MDHKNTTALASAIGIVEKLRLSGKLAGFTVLDAIELRDKIEQAFARAERAEKQLERDFYYRCSNPDCTKHGNTGWVHQDEVISWPADASNGTYCCGACRDAVEPPCIECREYPAHEDYNDRFCSSHCESSYYDDIDADRYYRERKERMGEVA